MRGRCRCPARWSSEPAARAVVEPVRALRPQREHASRHKRHELLALPPLTALRETVLMQFARGLHTSAMLVGLSVLLGGCASVAPTAGPSTLDQPVGRPGPQRRHGFAGGARRPQRQHALSTQPAHAAGAGLQPQAADHRGGDGRAGAAVSLFHPTAEQRHASRASAAERQPVPARPGRPDHAVRRLPGTRRATGEPRRRVRCRATWCSTTAGSMRSAWAWIGLRTMKAPTTARRFRR